MFVFLSVYARVCVRKRRGCSKTKPIDTACPTSIHFPFFPFFFFLVKINPPSSDQNSDET